MCILVTKSVSEGWADILLFRKHLSWNYIQVKQPGSDFEVLEDGDQGESHPTQWKILLDKGYQGLSQILRAIIPHKTMPEAFRKMIGDETRKHL